MAFENSTAIRVVATARDWIGTPYVHQASCKGAGTDCLDLIRGIERELYNDEPIATTQYSSDWNETNGSDQLLSAASELKIRLPK